MANGTLVTKILLLNGSKATWEKLATYVLAKGEPAVEFVDAPNSADSNALSAVKVKIGDGYTQYQNLPYVGDEIAASLAAAVERIAALETTVASVGSEVWELTNGEELPTVGKDGVSPIKSGSVAIVKTVINEQYTTDDGKTVSANYSYTAYVHNGEQWCAMDGNYNAENVILNEDLTYTANIGVKTVPASGSGIISAKGKSLEEVLKAILAEAKDPEKTDPTVTLKSSNIGAKEVGTNIAIAYSFDTTAGSYTYDDSTGVTFSDATATFNGETKNGTSGTFTSIQVTDTTNLKITGSIEQSAGIVPHNNIGEECEAKQIDEKSWTGLEKGTLTGYRAWFCGYKNGDNAIKNPETGAADATLITGAQIRALGNSANGSWKSSMDVAKMQQMFFAAPAGKGYKPAVADSKTTAPQTVLGPITVSVEGANGYTAIDYDVWYVNNTSAASGSATLTIKKA